MDRFALLRRMAGTAFLLALAACGGGSSSPPGSCDTGTADAPAPARSGPLPLTLAPQDGSFVSGCLVLQGSVTTSQPGGATVTAHFDGPFESLPDPANPLWSDVPPGTQVLATTTTGAFSARHPLARAEGGMHALRVGATDGTGSVNERRQVFVTTDPNLAYRRAFTLPDDSVLLAAEGNLVLYAYGSGWPTHQLRGAAVRDLVSGREVALANVASIVDAFRWTTRETWALSNGRVYASGKGGDCAFQCVYEWAADGSVRNLSNASPYSATPATASGRTFDQLRATEGGKVLWQNLNFVVAGWATLYDAGTGSYQRVAPSPPGTIDDLYVASSDAHVYYTAHDIFRWQASTDTSVRLTEDPTGKTAPQTEGRLLAWYQVPENLLLVRTLDFGPTTILSRTSFGASVREGRVAWDEYAGPSRIDFFQPPRPPEAVKVWTETGGALQLSREGARTARVLAHGDGHVVYRDDAEVYSWNAATGVRILRVQGHWLQASQVFIAGGALVFNAGPAVYRVPL